MLRPSIKRRIVGIATGMIILAVITSVMSMVLASRVGHLLDELTNRYIPAYADLARVDIRSLERALMLRQMIIARMQTPPDDASDAAHLKTFQEKEPEVRREAEAARKLIKAIIDDPSTPSDDVALTRIDERIDTAVNDLRHRLDEEIGQLLRQLEGQNFTEVLHGLARIDALYDEFNQKMDLIRVDMLGTSARERLNGYPQSATSHLDFGNCNGNCCCTRIGVRDAGWQRNHPSSVSIARGHTGG